VRSVQCHVASLRNVQVPMVSLPSRPADADAAEDWDNEMSDLFEWTGMACFGAQRLQANDRVDSFVAVYRPPEPSTVADLAHLRWRGFLSPDFVQTVIDAACVSTDTVQFVSISAHAFPTAPVPYIPVAKDGKPTDLNPLRQPRADGEDTWSIVITSDANKVRWCIAESIGTLDNRWG